MHAGLAWGELTHLTASKKPTTAESESAIQFAQDQISAAERALPMPSKCHLSGVTRSLAGQLRSTLQRAGETGSAEKMKAVEQQFSKLQKAAGAAGMELSSRYPTPKS
jgi:hypothetical protein